LAVRIIRATMVGHGSKCTPIPFPDCRKRHTQNEVTQVLQALPRTCWKVTCM